MAEPTRKSPPSSLEVEQAILGLMLRGAEKNGFDEYDLQDKDFYFPYNQVVFRAILNVEQKDQPVDYATVLNELNRLEHSDDFDYDEYVRGLVEEATALGSFEQYATILKNHAIMRLLLVCVRDIELNIYEQKIDYEDILGKAEKVIFDVSSQLQTQDHLRHITNVSKSAKHQIEEKAQRGNDIEFETGFAALDKITNGLQPGDLVIIAGRPSMGKTSFAMNIAEHLATIKDKGVAIFSMEMNAESLVMRLFSAMGKIPLQHLRDAKLSNEEWMKLTTVMNELDKTDIVIDNTANMSPAEIRTRARKATKMMQKPLGLIMVDYIQLMRGNSSRDGNRVLEVSDISRSLKSLAIEMDVPVVALSQLSRAVELRQSKRPMMSDLRESGAIEQDADLILFIYRDEVYNTGTEEKGIAEINISKHRNGETGMVRLKFFGQYTRFENLANSGDQDFIISHQVSDGTEYYEE